MEKLKDMDSIAADQSYFATTFCLILKSSACLGAGAGGRPSIPIRKCEAGLA